MSEACTACGATLIVGVSSCVVCGEPTDDDTPTFRIAVVYPEGMRPMTDEEVARLNAENAARRAYARRLMEAQALEYAGDIDRAIELYEALLIESEHDVVPYRRLAIVYRKLKREADEDRIVRAAIARFGGGREGWFVLRLARIIGKKRKAKGGEP